LQLSGLVNMAGNPNVVWVAQRTSARTDGKPLPY
jgi:hypothetical protein